MTRLEKREARRVARAERRAERSSQQPLGNGAPITLFGSTASGLYGESWQLIDPERWSRALVVWAGPREMMIEPDWSFTGPSGTHYERRGDPRVLPFGLLDEDILWTRGHDISKEREDALLVSLALRSS